MFKYKEFLPNEKRKLRELTIKPSMDYNKVFSVEERDILSQTLKYASAAYLDSSIRYFPSTEKATRIELTVFLEKNSEIEKVLKNVNKIIRGKYSIVVDFWSFGKSSDNELKLMYPSWVNI